MGVAKPVGCRLDRAVERREIDQTDCSADTTTKGNLLWANTSTIPD